jgi:hypothetical protein
MRVTDALCSLGFEVRTATEVDSATLKLAVVAFAQDNRTDQATRQVRLVYYSGHGIQADGANYLIPVDATVETAVAVGMGFPFINDAASVGARGRDAIKILLFDACRSLLPVEKGFAAPGEQPRESFIGYATSPGAVANAEEAGKPSPWTAEILKRIRTPGLGIKPMFAAVHGVLASANRQFPETWEGIGSDFYFNPPPTINWSVLRVDDDLRVTLNNASLLQSKLRSGSTEEMSFSLLKLGANSFTAILHNQKTRRNSHFWELREGWNYDLVLSISEGLLHPAQNYKMHSDGETADKEPPDSRWGEEFEVYRGIIQVDALAGSVTASGFVAPLDTNGSCTDASGQHCP